jgi:hypothetical protein
MWLAALLTLMKWLRFPLAFSDNMALQVVKLLREAYGRVKRLLRKVCLATMMGSAPA